MKPSNANKPPEILAIDDETDILDIIQATLQDQGYKVHVAASPTQGLELFEQHRREIKLVLLDYLMPEMTGDLVFESLQRIDPGVRVILLTACEDSVAKKMFAAGLRGYIQKPFYLDDLVERVREELETV
jgi:DNA-binding response OmpR family regulator